MEKQRTIHLIDGSSYLYRAFYGVRRLSNSKGLPTNAIFGFAQMVLKILREQQPRYICAVFDTPEPTFRHNMYEPYKATRQKAPEELVEQIPFIKQLLDLHGIPRLEAPGWEADDIIATLTRKAEDAGMHVVIISGDKDLHQMIDAPRVIQWDPQRDRIITEKEVEERFGVTPAQIRDYLSLVGDSSDNIPGVPGVGAKTAEKLLKEYVTLDNLYSRVEEVSPASVRKKLSENKEMALLSRELVTLREDLPLPKGPEELVVGSPSKENLTRLYEDLEFKGLLDSLRKEWSADAESGAAPERDRAPETAPTDSPKQARKDVIIRTDEELATLIERLETTERFSVDLETTSEDSMLAKIVGISLSFEDHEAYYVPVAHTGGGSEGQLPRRKVLDALAPLLGRADKGKVGQNLKYEWVTLLRHGVDLRGIAFDSMVASYLLNPGSHTHKLERIALEHLGEGMISYEDVTGKGKEQIGFAEVDVERAAEYSCEDAEIAWRLAPVLGKKLRELRLDELYHTLELPLVEVLARMEYTGVLIDASGFEELSLDLEKAMEQKAQRIYEIAGEEFNIQSPKQLGAVLFERLKLPVRKKTKSGPSTDMTVLEDLAAEGHEIADCVIAHRSLAKLKGTYVDALPKLIHPETGRIHTSYNQTVAATGRLSSSNPNLQNIPIRSEEGRKIREAFVPKPDCVLLSADYSQIELRLLAHYCKDKRLVEAFHADEDIHRRTAAEMFMVPPERVNSDMRRQAKAINFGIIYGMGAFGLARQLRTTNTRAKAAIERYFQQYRGVKTFIDEVVRQAVERGYSETLLGRIRPIPEIQSRNQTIRRQGERLAVNTTIQGAAADLIKKAMIDIQRTIEERKMATVMILQVHDELVFEVPEKEMEAARAMVKEKMEGVWRLDVPLKVDMGEGMNWAAAHP